MTPRKRFLTLTGSLLLIAAVLVTLLWQPIAARFTPPPSPPEKVTIAVSSHYIGSGLVFVAVAKGYFAQEGLAVTLQPHTSGRDALDAALEQRADLGTVGNTPLMFAVLKDMPVSIVATIHNIGQVYGVVARRDRGIAGPADLRGKTVGVTYGTDSHFVLATILADAGLSLDQVRTENMNPEETAAALLSGRVDAISAWEPWLSMAGKALGTNGATFFTDRGFLFGFHLAGRKEWVEAHPQTLQRLLRALIRAEELVAANPAEARRIISIEGPVSAAVYDSASAINSFRVTLDQSLLIVLEDQMRWAIQSGLVERKDPPNLLGAFHVRALEVVLPARVTLVR